MLNGEGQVNKNTQIFLSILKTKQFKEDVLVIVIYVVN